MEYVIKLQYVLGLKWAISDENEYGTEVISGYLYETYVTTSRWRDKNVI